MLKGMIVSLQKSVLIPSIVSKMYAQSPHPSVRLVTFSTIDALRTPTASVTLEKSSALLTLF